MPGFDPGTSRSLYQLSYRVNVINGFENYLLKNFKNHAADLGPVLVYTCYDQPYLLTLDRRSSFYSSFSFFSINTSIYRKL